MPNITCKHYEPRSDSKQCKSFISDGKGSGGCRRADVLMCTEWLKVNEPAGRPKFNAPKPAPEPEPAPSPTCDLSPASLASFKALGVTLGLDLGPAGKVFLVPEYTGRDRLELSVDHAALLISLCTMFPRATITEIERER